MRSDREKAKEVEIPGEYKQLAVQIRTLLGYYSEDMPLLSGRQAALMCSVNHATISSLVRGGRASRETLKQIADTFGGDYEKLCRLAGYSLLPTNPAISSENNAAANQEIAGLPERIYHKLERLSDRDLRKLDQIVELWIDDGDEVGS